MCCRCLSGCRLCFSLWTNELLDHHHHQHHAQAGYQEEPFTYYISMLWPLLCTYTFYSKATQSWCGKLKQLFFYITLHLADTPIQFQFHTAIVTGNFTKCTILHLNKNSQLFDSIIKQLNATPLMLNIRHISTLPVFWQIAHRMGLIIIEFILCRYLKIYIYMKWVVDV